MDVRRLAAIDMHGTSGTPRRRRLILAEFVLGAVIAFGLGIWVLRNSDFANDRFFAVWVLGVGLNYLPLAFYAVLLARRGALDRELEGVDVDRELRRYTMLQFWVLVPALFLVLAIRDARQGRGGRGGSDTS